MEKQMENEMETRGIEGFKELDVMVPCSFYSYSIWYLKWSSKDLGNIFRPLYCSDFAGHLERRVQGLG